jgi:hypothetical protein
MPVTVGRRELIAGLGSTVAWPLAAPAQQGVMPVIGFLGSASPDHRVRSYRQGLAEAGYVEGRNVAIDFRWAESQGARKLGIELHILHASSERDFDGVFTSLVRTRAGALVIGSDAFYVSRSKQLGALTARHAVPAIYQFREFVEAGGLLSYGSSITDAYRLVGVYTGRILRGEKPADLPVQQSTKVELIINMKTAKALGLAMPATRRHGRSRRAHSRSGRSQGSDICHRALPLPGRWPTTTNSSAGYASLVMSRGETSSLNIDLRTGSLIGSVLLRRSWSSSMLTSSFRW